MKKEYIQPIMATHEFQVRGMIAASIPISGDTEGENGWGTDPQAKLDSWDDEEFGW